MQGELVLIVGGTGMLGEPVARQLRRDGYRVRIFTHSPDKARAMFSDEYEIFVGNVEDRASLDRALQDCAGVHINLRSPSDPGLEERGVKHIAAAAAAARASLRKITYLSGATVNEENAWFAATRAKLQAESAIRSAGVPHTIFRAASFFENLPSYVRGKSASVIGKQPHPWRWLAAADYALMVSEAYTRADHADQTVYALGPEAMTTREALSAYCRIAAPGAKVRSMPIWMAKLVARIFRIEDLANALPYLEYFETARETVPPHAVSLVGTTTLEQWSIKNSSLQAF
jgi:uncharacterized protein YbjT (DUF2867 family)